jgi:hypothetical protein
MLTSFNHGKPWPPTRVHLSLQLDYKIWQKPVRPRHPTKQKNIARRTDDVRSTYYIPGKEEERRHYSRTRKKDRE